MAHLVRAEDKEQRQRIGKSLPEEPPAARIRPRARRLAGARPRTRWRAGSARTSMRESPKLSRRGASSRPHARNERRGVLLRAPGVETAPLRARNHPRAHPAFDPCAGPHGEGDRPVRNFLFSRSIAASPAGEEKKSRIAVILTQPARLTHLDTSSRNSYPRVCSIRP